MLRGLGAEVWDRLGAPATVTELLSALELPSDRAGEVVELLDSLVSADLVDRR